MFLHTLDGEWREKRNPSFTVLARAGKRKKMHEKKRKKTIGSESPNIITTTLLLVSLGCVCGPSFYFPIR
jgi:hypothetical protein